MSYEKLTARHLNLLKARISDTLAAKGIDNTGGASASLEVKGNKLMGNDYLYYLDQGSKPWTHPQDYKSLGFILDKSGWAKNRGVNPYAAAYGIANKGSRIFRDKSKGIQLDSLVDEMLENLIKELPDEVAAEVLKWE